MYHYSTPPPGWSTYDYSQSPPTSPYYAQYASQYANPYTSPRGTSRRHTRKASYTATKEPSYYGYPQTYYEPTPEQGIPPRKHDHVSASYAGPPKHRRNHTTGHPAGDGLGTGPNSSQKRPIFVDVVDDAYDVRYAFSQRPRPGRPPATTKDSHRRTASTAQRKSNPAADSHFYFNQVPNNEDIESARRSSRARRQSTSTRTPNKPKPAPAATKPPPTATEEDAERAGIPPGYSIKNWDPTEAPIILLGSVFDASSLGKWIYDWTVFHHGASTPMADVAGDLWLLLIKLAGKVKRADECLPRIKCIEAQEVVEDFLESGDRLWSRFKKLLKGCELYMWKAAKRESGKGAPVSMGRNAGCEFVESIFGRDRELENTEKLMNSIRLWNMRFDANCEDILRRPSAK
ncbi:uncharacterized protein N7484_009363 [Penicillium longicatenatum]|uniref:uncharacterized protein n=1 Tax=Penicillium longicatenatum TaxID=1561947 RepID=UPI0025479507|nr:uncharacterized protein N7484_009363 [Penicillium longicatenatum]KAJ5636050.1 hypothetical protein N7484_009363 [Penicillium longicatenatum]